MVVSYGSDDTSEFGRMSTKKLAILFGLAFFGAFMVIQMVQGFPLAELFTRQTVTEEVTIDIKQENICVVEPSDRQPKRIENCPYDLHDIIIVSYYEGSTKVETHSLK